MNHSRFEKTRIIATRALQIAQGAPVLVTPPKGAKPIDIAKLEWEANLIPISIKEKKSKKSEEKSSS